MSLNIHRSHFSANVIVGTVGGGALPNDADPNEAEPPAERVFRFPSDLGLSINGQSRVVIIIVGGTSLTYRGWWFDDTARKWFALGGAATITQATTNIAALGVGSMVGAKIFVQMVANSGVEQLVYFAN